MSDLNLSIVRKISGEDSVTYNDATLILDSSEEDGEFNLQLPKGKNDFIFRFGISQASVDNNVIWTLVPTDDDVIDTLVGTLTTAPKAIVFKNGAWYLTA